MLLNFIILVVITLSQNYFIFGYGLHPKSAYIPNQIGKLNLRLPGKMI